ncbi:16304_t:CDS:1, partial [Gigaspora rosea]
MESNLNKNNTIIPHIFLSHNIEPQSIIDDNLLTLEHALPLNYNYIIDLFEAIQPLNFLGAFSEPFKAKFLVNICTVDNANIWLDEFSNLYKVTMRETQGRIIKGVKYIFSKRFHCVHSYLVKLKQGQKGENDSNNIGTMGKEK